MYQALYRKYRPATFSDVVGQEHITTALRREVATGKTSHAYLFTGSRGTGKTTCSKVLAKAVNCLRPDEGNPCGACEICRGVDDGSLLDVTEIDAASNNGVDNIRQLREEAYFLPTQAAKRVYIIDETHMLSTGAFNALLKIMEEPPAHVLFILATTEAHKIPATILSRCQRFDFHRIESGVIAGRLEAVAAREEITLAHDAALLIARLSDGGMRDALSLLDLCASHGGIVDSAAVAAAAGLAGRDYLHRLTDAVVDGNAAAALETTAELYAQGADPERLCGELTAHFRDLMILKSSQRPDDLLALPPEEIERMRGQCARLRLSHIFYSLSVLQETIGRMGRSAGRRTDLELAVVRLCTPQLDSSPEALLARIERLESGVAVGPARREPAAPPAGRPLQEPVEQLGVSPAPVRGEEAMDESHPVTASSDSLPVRLEEWTEVLSRLAKINPALHGTLHGSSAYVRGDLCLIDSANPLFFELIRKSDEAKNTLREAVAQQTGRRYRLGPYQREREEAKPAALDPLDELARQAREAGVSIEMTES